MKNIQYWKIKLTPKRHKVILKSEDIRDVYKKEILDTRIIVSEIASESRMVDLSISAEPSNPHLAD